MVTLLVLYASRIMLGCFYDLKGTLMEKKAYSKKGEKQPITTLKKYEGFVNGFNKILYNFNIKFLEVISETL